MWDISSLARPSSASAAGVVPVIPAAGGAAPADSTAVPLAGSGDGIAGVRCTGTIHDAHDVSIVQSVAYSRGVVFSCGHDGYIRCWDPSRPWALGRGSSLDCEQPGGVCVKVLVMDQPFVSAVAPCGVANKVFAIGLQDPAVRVSWVVFLSFIASFWLRSSQFSLSPPLFCLHFGFILFLFDLSQVISV